MKKERRSGTIIRGDFMSTTVYVVRHCEALGNLTGRFQGHVDSDISETGALQLKFLAKRFENVELDAVYASPLTRADKTAHSVADAKGLPVITRQELIELNVGDLENLPLADFKNKQKKWYDIWVNYPWDFRAPNGESMREIYERIWNAVLKIARENEGKTVLVASHGCAIRNLLCRLLFGDIEKMNEIGIGNNTSVSKLIFNGEEVTVEYFADSSHLPEEALPPTSRYDYKFGDYK